MTPSTYKQMPPMRSTVTPVVTQAPRPSLLPDEGYGRPSPDSTPLFANALAVIRRIEGYLDEETEAFGNPEAFDLAASNNRKSQGLMELNRAIRALAGSECEKEIRVHLAVLREKLDANLRVIRMHLSAVREISAVLSEAIQSADSDGTYTPSIRAPRSVA